MVDAKVVYFNASTLSIFQQNLKNQKKCRKKDSKHVLLCTFVRIQTTFFPRNDSLFLL